MTPEDCESFGDEFVRKIAQVIAREHAEASPDGLRVVVRDV